LARKRGGKRKALPLFDVNPKRQRATAEVAMKRISEIANEEDIIDEADAGTLLTQKAIWKLFQFSDSQEKNLPSKEACLNASVHSDESQRGKTTWSTLCQTMVSIIRESAQVLYPGAPEILIDNAVHREMVVYDRPRELLEEAAKKTSNLGEVAPKGSTQRRVLDACLVKHFPSYIQTKLKKKGWNYPTAAHKLRA
jgi:hypothetical protein